MPRQDVPKPMEFHVIVERDENGAFLANVPELPGCRVYGKSKDEVMARIREAIPTFLEVRGPPRIEFVALERVHVDG